MRERAGASVLADGASASVCGAGLLGSSISYGLEHKEVYPELTAESERGRLSWRRLVAATTSCECRPDTSLGRLSIARAIRAGLLLPVYCWLLSLSG